MPSRDRQIIDIEDYPGENIFKERIAFIYDAVKYYLEANNLREYVGISYIQIYEIIINYFADIKRLKDFHEIERTNLIKVAAYTSYWFVKMRPLFLKNDPDEILLKKYPMLKYINESLGITILIAIVFPEKSLHFMNTEGLKKWNDFIKNLRYFFSYRVVTPQAIELILLSLFTDSPYNC